MKFPFPVVVLAASLLSVSRSLLAQPAAPAPVSPALVSAQVEVSAVNFEWARFAGDVWLEAAVELDVKPGGKQVAGEFVNRVRTTISFLSQSADGKGEKHGVYFRANAEAISLESGRATLRFFLPPEVVRRDKVRTEIKYYAVDVDVGGESQTPARAGASASFSSSESLQNFRSRVTAEAAINEGLLMPQHLTPFANDPQRRTPTVLRREPQR